MKKIPLSIIMVIGLAFLAALFFGSGFSEKPKNYPNKVEISLNGTIFESETALSPWAQAKGLSGRDSLCSQCAMLFVFKDSAVRNFWMKDMQFDLDMIWISGSKIVKIDKNISHEGGSSTVVNSESRVDKVIELNAGTSDRLQLKDGDQIFF